MPPFSAPGSAAHAAAASVCRDPFCRDPACPTAVYNAQIATAAALSGLPPGYAELLQAQKLGLGLPPTSIGASALNAAAAASAAATSANGGPYVCSWMNGREGYCGKRHSSAEELLQHLRTHTNLSTSDSVSSLLSSSLYHQSGLFSGSPGGSAAAAAAAALGLHRGYGAVNNSAAALGSLSAANRFHPYSKPGSAGAAAAGGGSGSSGSALPPTLGLGGLGLPPSLPPSLAAAYSPTAAASLYASLYGGNR